MNKRITFFCLGLLLGHTFLYAQQSFQNVTASMGISGQTGLGHAVGWGDIDNDGDPDLGLSNQEGDGFWFYRNNGNNFTNITASGGLSGLGGNKIIIAELTGDDYNDLLLRTRSGTQYLFESNGDGTFNNITASAGITSASVYNIADFDNDGYTDLLSVANNNFSILYNNGNGTFTDVAASTGTSGHHDTRTVVFVDYNNDGWLDIFSSHHDFYSYSNTMLRNNGDNTFTEVAVDLGLSGEWIGDYFGQGWADFNLDGAIDLFAAGHIDKYRLFKNTNCPGSFLNIHLIGIESNPNGIGAKLDVWVSGQRISRNVLPNGGFHDNSDLKLHFGLDGAYSADSLIVYWPSGIIQKLFGINANQFLTIVEDETTRLDEKTNIENAGVTVYPNPVISHANIQYTIYSIQYTNLVVYDSFGMKVKTLVDEIQEPGTYTVTFDTEGLPGGVYFYRLTAEGQVASGKMIKY